MIDIEIPYWTWIQIKCPSCWYEWLPDSKKKWMTSLAVVLYICWIFPGIIYNIWRNSSRICRCPKCWQVNVREINWDDELVNTLLKLNKMQNYAFVGAILIAVLIIFWLHDYRLSNQGQQQKNTVSILYQQRSNTYQQPSNNNINPAVKDTQNTTEPEQPVIVEQPKNANDEAREKMASILSEINNKYWNEASYIWASCSWDCINWIVNIEFSEDIWWRDFTVKAHAAMWSNKIIETIPGFFHKIWINFIYNWQTICNCIFAEYQSNLYAPKWCTYYWYKE